MIPEPGANRQQPTAKTTVSEARAATATCTCAPSITRRPRLGKNALIQRQPGHTNLPDVIGAALGAVPARELEGAKISWSIVTTR